MKSIPSLMFLAAAAGLAPTAQAARRDLFDAPFVAVPPMMLDDFFKTGPRMDFPGPGVSRTEQYTLGVLPTAPVFHPYTFYQDNTRPDPDSGDGRKVPEYLLHMKFSPDFEEALPPNLKARLQTLALKPGELEIYCEVQTQAWPDSQVESFRPHYWANPKAPASGQETRSNPIRVGIFDAPPSIRFFGHRASDFFPSLIVIHPQPMPPAKQGQPAPEPRDRPILSSPRNLSVHGLNFRQTSCFWTLCQLEPEGKAAPRVAATLQVLLNDADARALKALMPRLTTLRSLVRELDRPASGLAGSPMATQLKRLTRPLIAHRELAVPPGSGTRTLTLTGSGFSEVSGVTCGGRRLELLEADDSHLKLALADAPADQEILVDTPMGTGRFPETAALVPEPPALAADPAPGQPNLWEDKGGKVLTIPAKSDSAEEHRSLPCAPGEIIIGEAEVRTEGMITKNGHDQGFAGLGLRFENAARQEIGAGEAAGYDYPTETNAPLPVRVRVRGTAPAGTAWVSLLLQAKGCQPSAKATYDAVSFKRWLPAGAEPEAPRPGPAPVLSPNLWPADARTTLAVPDHAVVQHTLRFAPGEVAVDEVFTGEAYVQTTAMRTGHALIGIRFDCVDGSTAFGGRMNAQVPMQTASEARVRVGVQAKAPRGVTRVTLSIQTRGCNPGAQATFDSVTFTRRTPPPAAGPDR